MEVTDVRVRRQFSEGNMKAIVSITFDDAFVVHDIKVVEGANGLFVAMPSRKTVSGEFRDIAHPINKEARAMIEESVIGAYLQAQESLREAERTYVAWRDAEREEGEEKVFPL